MLEFRSRQHVEMLDLNEFTKLVDIKKLKIIFEKQCFVNFTVQENSINSLLSLQGYYLKNFIYFHLRHDMRFKASIDSYMIEKDDPYTRNTIREENRKDSGLSEKYLGLNFNIETFCIHLLDNFFPDISGIWADYNHMAPAYILQFVRIALEYGFISGARARQMIPLLKKVAMSLLKLEEGWIERPVESKKFSIKVKLHDIMILFAKCREHMAMITINILVLLNDVYFLEKFPEYVRENSSEEKVKKEMLETFYLFNKEINDSVLLIAMNYLSSSVEILEFKSTNDFCKLAVEKVFLLVTTTQKDCFLNSLKQITPTDLRYIDKVSPITLSLRERADITGNSFRLLLELIGKGLFDKTTGKLDSAFSPDKNFEVYLRKYTQSDGGSTIDSILTKMIMDIVQTMKSETDYKVAVVKESIPYMLVAIINYCSDYFEDPIYPTIAKESFRLLGVLCQNNNYAKAQILKGECLFHFRMLLSRYDQEALMFLFLLADEHNVAVFFGKEVFSLFLRLYEQFNSDICDKLRIDDPTAALNIEKSGTQLLMTKTLLKLMSKSFASESEKLQNILLTQETIFTNIVVKLLPILIKLARELGDSNQNRDNLTVTNELYLEGNELALKKRLKTDLDNLSLKVLMVHVSYYSLVLFNNLTHDCFSSHLLDMVQPIIGDVRQYIEECQVQRSDWALPNGLEAEFVTFLRNFQILPQQHILIEYPIDLDTTILEISTQSARKELKSEHDQYKQRIADLRLEIRSKGQNSTLQNQIVGYEQKLSSLETRGNQIFYHSMKLFQTMFRRIKLFRERIELQSSGKMYLADGLFPLVSKYVKTIKSLAVLDNSKRIKLNYYKVLIIVKTLLENKADIEDLFQKQIKEDFSLAGFSEEELNNVNFEESLLTFKDKEFEQRKSLDLMKSSIGDGCTMLITVITGIIEGTNMGQKLQQEIDISRKDFVASIYASSNTEIINDQQIKLKRDVLNLFIKEFQEAKDLYLDREEEPNLMNFFDRNTQNLRGVFNSCLDRLLSRTKAEKLSKKDYLAFSLPISRFWVYPSCIPYINMLTMVVSKSKTARAEFFEFIREDKPEEEGDPEDAPAAEAALSPGDRIIEEKKPMTALESHQKDYSKEAMMSILIRIQADLLFYLANNSHRHKIWWVTHQTYEMISMFFKNLCECNYMPFKNYLGESCPEIDDPNWNKFRSKSYTRIFSGEFSFLMKTSLLGVNRDPVMLPSDNHDKMQEILLPLVRIINEEIIGPCQVNQEIFIKSDITSLCNMATRLLDDINSPFNDLSSDCLSLLLALTEGRKESILMKIANRLPASMIIDKMHRLMKKLYVQNLIKAGDYDKFKSENTKEKERKMAKENEEAMDRNKIVPISKESLDKQETDAEDEIKPNIIDEIMENRVKIQDWQDLLQLYMEEEEFSESPMFDFIFRLMVLWKALSVCSKNHQNRMDDANYEAKVCEKESLIGGLSSFINLSFLKNLVTLNLQQTVRPSEFAHIFYFITKKIMVEIEVLDPEERSVMMNFPRLPPCFMLSDEAKKNYLSECDISDSNTKMLDLLRNFDLFCIQMESSFKTSIKLGKLYSIISTDAYFYYTNFCWILGFIINIVLLIGWSKETETYVQKEHFEPKNDTYSTLMQVLAIILIAISGILLVIWIITKYPQTYLTRMEDYKFDNPGKNPKKLSAKLYVAVVKSFLHEPFPTSYVLHIIFTVLGLTVFHIFYTLNLLLIINISKTTKFVLQAILLHIDQLALTFMLAMFVIYCYTMLIMDNLYDQIALDNGNQVCGQLYTCFFYVLNMGLRNGGGFAESLVGIDKDKKFAGRTVFDMSFFMLINVISLNIIFGIIIDTFSQLRDDQNERSKVG